MYRLKPIILFILLTSLAIPLWGQPQITNFLISVWPEYDHPGVLVIFNGHIQEEQLPAEVKFPVPERSRFALVAGTSDTTQNKMIRVPIRDSEKGKEIAFTVVHPSFHVEFYFNPFKNDSEERHYHYQFFSNLHIDSMMIDLQQPLTAEDFTPEIKYDHRMQDSHGITYYRAHRNNLEPGTVVEIAAKYQNPSGQMSSATLRERMGEQGSGQGMQTPGQSTTQAPKRSFWLLGVIILVVTGMLFYITQSKKQKPEVAGRGASKSAKETEDATSQDQGQKRNTKYCIHCGEEISNGAKFCTQCGEKQPD